MYSPSKATSFPELKAKAAEVRHLAEPLHALCQELLNGDNEVHKNMVLIMKMAVNMESVMDEHKDEFRLPPAAAAKFKESAYAFAALTAVLGHHFHPRGDRLFNFTIKSHYLCHLGDTAAYWNPRKSWCYAGEDMMHKMKVLIQSSQRGAAAHVVVPKVIRKYVQGLELKLSQSMWRK